MEMIDIILLSIIALFGIIGIAVGFIHAVGSFLGLVIGVYLASRFYAPVADWLMYLIGRDSNFIRVLMFVVAFVLIAKLVGLAFFFLEKVFNILKFIPFVKTFNRFLGFLFGLAEGMVVVGMIIFFIDKFPLSDRLMAGLANSVVAPYAEGIASILWPLLPQSIRLLESTVDYFI
ncbi:MAG: CvpA family protein [bacterium]|nr:CvpA family protein [bacterium]